MAFTMANENKYIEDRLGKREVKAKGRCILELEIKKMDYVETTQRKRENS